jgi:hypothetical protein
MINYINVLIPLFIAFITAVVGPVLVEWIKAKLKSKPTKTPIQEAVELNELVDTQLDTIMDELECNRIWIAQFHNGGHFYPTGKSIQKFSFFYEKVTPNTISTQHTFQNIPVSLFPKALGKLYKDGELSILSYTNGSETYDLDTFSTEYDTKSFYAVGLHSLDNHLIGIMGISFTENEYKMTKENWIFLRQKIGVIGTLLTDYLKAKR